MKSRRVGAHIDQELLDQRADEPFLESRVGTRVLPDTRQVLSEGAQARDVDRGGCADGGQPREVALLSRDRIEGGIPATLQFRRHQPIGGIHGIVLTPGALRFVPELFEGEPGVCLPLGLLLLRLCGRRERGIDGAGRDHGEDGVFHGPLKGETTEGQAVPRAVIDHGPTTIVAAHFPIRPTIRDV